MFIARVTKTRTMQTGRKCRSLKGAAIVRRGVAFHLVVVWAGACRSRSDPELTLQAYVRAVGEGRCGDALKLLSARTRHAIDVLGVKSQHPWGRCRSSSTTTMRSPSRIAG